MMRASALARLRQRVSSGFARPWSLERAVLGGLLGAAAGALAAEALVRVLPLWTGLVDQAREAGVLSATVVAGYPKASELLFLLVGLLLTGVGSLAGALAAVVSGPPERGSPLAVSSDAGWRGFGRFEISVLLAVLLLGAWPTPLLTSWSPWRILHEEGVHLIAAQTLQLGGRLYEDVRYLYGPLLALPLAALFEFVPASVFNARVLALALHGAGLALVAAAARPLFRTRLGWLTLCGVLLLFVPLAHPRLHLTAWRTAVALVPLLCLAGSAVRGRGAWAASGSLAAAAAFTSPEALFPALAGPLVWLIVAPPPSGRGGALAALLGGTAVAALILSLVLMPFSAGLAFASEAFDTLVGFGGGYLTRVHPVPWGASRLWYGDPFGVGGDLGKFLLHGNAILAVALGFGIVLGVRFLQRPLNSRDALLLATTVVALGLLPKLIARIGWHQFMKVYPPLLVVAVALAEDGWRARGMARGSRFTSRVLAVAPLVVLVVALGGVRPLAWPQLPRSQDSSLGPIFVDPSLVRLVQRVRSEVDRRIPPEEGIWAYPNAAGWNLLLGRPPAHPLASTLWLKTEAQRRDALRRLDEHPPQLILLHRMRDDMDGIAMARFAGPIEPYLEEHYRVTQEVREGKYRVELLEPRGP